MKPALISAAVLAASLSVAAGNLPPAGAASSAPVSSAAATDAAVSPSLSCADRDELRAVELRDADLSDVKAGFAMSDNDTVLVLGTIAVVVLIALLL